MPLVEDLPFFFSPLDDQPLDGWLEHYSDRARLRKLDVIEVKSGWAQNGGRLLGRGHFTLCDRNGLQLMNFENFNDTDFHANLERLEGIIEKLKASSNAETVFKTIKAPPSPKWEFTFRGGDGLYLQATLKEKSRAQGAGGNEWLPVGLACDVADASGDTVGEINLDFNLLRELGIDNKFIGNAVRIGSARIDGNTGYIFFTEDKVTNYEKSELTWDEQNEKIVLGNMRVYSTEENYNNINYRYTIEEIRMTQFGYSMIDTKDDNFPPNSFFRVEPNGEEYYCIYDLFSLGTGVIAGKPKEGNPLGGSNPHNIRQLPKWNTPQLFYKDARKTIYSIGRYYVGDA
jgi:hypothetical protein